MVLNIKSRAIQVASLEKHYIIWTARILQSWQFC